MGVSWPNLLANYAIWRGEPWPFVLLLELMAPVLFGWLGTGGAALAALIDPYGHFTSGGIDIRIASTFPPVFSPNVVPRS